VTVSGDHAEMPKIQGQNLATVALGAGDDAGIREAEGQVFAAIHELADAGKVFLPALQDEPAGLEVRDEGLEHPRSQAAFDHVRDFGQYSEEHEIGQIEPPTEVDVLEDPAV